MDITKLEQKLNQHTFAPIEIVPDTVSGSYIGHDCMLHIFNQATGIAQKFDEESIKVMREGHLHEEDVVHRLKLMRIKVRSRSMLLEDKEHGITGHPDGIISGNVPGIISSSDGEELLEVKSTGLDKFLGANEESVAKDYMYKSWHSQIQTYLYLLSVNNIPIDSAILVVKCRDTGDIKVINIKRNIHYMLALLNKALDIQEAIEEKICPIAKFKQACMFCGFMYICSDEFGECVEEGFDDLIPALQRLEILKPLIKEEKKIRKTIKERTKGLTTVKAGDYVINGREVERDGYYAKNCVYWTSTITKKGG